MWAHTVLIPVICSVYLGMLNILHVSTVIALMWHTCILNIFILVFPLFELSQCQSKAAINEEGDDNNQLSYDTISLKSTYYCT